jgi:hypothetical protein
MVSVTPVGNYFGKGGVQGVHASIMDRWRSGKPWRCTDDAVSSAVEGAVPRTMFRSALRGAKAVSFPHHRFDRAAPRGTGAVKAGGNYAADLLPLKLAKAEGFGTTLYLDCVEHR